MEDFEGHSAEVPQEPSKEERLQAAIDELPEADFPIIEEGLKTLVVDHILPPENCEPGKPAWMAISDLEHRFHLYGREEQLNARLHTEREKKGEDSVDPALIHALNIARLGANMGSHDSLIHQRATEIPGYDRYLKMVGMIIKAHTKKNPGEINYNTLMYLLQDARMRADRKAHPDQH